MPRTTPDLVAGIIDVAAGVDLNPFIGVANSLVTEQCAPGIADTVRLEMIERYLAAHLYSIKDPLTRTTSEHAGDVSATFAGKGDGEFFTRTQYGETAILLDTTGNLNRIGKQLPVHRILFIGGHGRHRH